MGWSSKASWTRGLELSLKEFMSERKEGGFIKSWNAISKHIMKTMEVYKPQNEFKGLNKITYNYVTFYALDDIII